MNGGTQNVMKHESGWSKLAKEHDLDATELRNLMDRISYHETGPNQRGSPRAIQENIPGRQYGRGQYQYELGSDYGEGKGSGGGRTAMNRLYASLGGSLVPPYKVLESMPEFMSPYFQPNTLPSRSGLEFDRPFGDVDFIDLSPDAQDLLFMSDKLRSGSFEGGVPTTSEEIANWWFENHQRGEEDVRTSKLESFQESMTAYDQEEANKLADAVIETPSNLAFDKRER